MPDSQYRCSPEKNDAQRRESDSRRSSCRLTGLIVFLVSGLTAGSAIADIILPGFKKVKHELVFESSELFDSHRLVAAPIAGFKGVAVIQPGQPFRFSSKYGTQFYVVPKKVMDLPEFDQQTFAQWPHCSPPKAEINQVPVSNPTASALTTLRLAEVTSEGPVIEIVSHIELDQFGNVASPTRNILLFGLLIAAGLAFCLIAIRRMKSADKRALKQSAQSASGSDIQ